MKKSETNQILPKQETFLSTEKLKHSARAGTHLPDPTMAPPYGNDPKAGRVPYRASKPIAPDALEGVNNIERS